MPDQIENRMVVDSLWNDWVSNPEPDGYYNRYSDEFVSKENALDSTPNNTKNSYSSFPFIL